MLWNYYYECAAWTGEDNSMQYAVNSIEVSAPVALNRTAAPQIGVHRRVRDSKM